MISVQETNNYKNWIKIYCTKQPQIDNVLKSWNYYFQEASPGHRLPFYLIK